MRFTLREDMSKPNKIAINPINESPATEIKEEVEEKVVEEKKTTKKKMTLLQAIERVVELAENSKMSPEFMKSSRRKMK